MRMGKPQVTCSDVVRHLGEELNSLITARAFREIRRHLIRCPNCKTTLDSLDKVIGLYRLYPDPLLTRAVRRRLYTILVLAS